MFSNQDQQLIHTDSLTKVDHGASTTKKLTTKGDSQKSNKMKHPSNKESRSNSNLPGNNKSSEVVYTPSKVSSITPQLKQELDKQVN